MNEEGARILVVDDERSVRRFLRVSLSAHTFKVYEAISGRAGLEAVASLRPDVVILDLGLPDMDGVDVVRQIREWSNIPIIILSIREQEQEKIVALDAGADDYLTKPFGIGELMARIRAAIRRASQIGDAPVIQIDRLRIDLAKRRVTFGDQEISLTPTEYDILRLLARHAGKVITHGQILHQIWGTRDESDLHILRVNISNLRSKIEKDLTLPQYILTEPGVGYRLQDPSYSSSESRDQHPFTGSGV